jgi:D-glycero-D-manno-heptose 1,7-bisphosphate phosphatase
LNADSYLKINFAKLNTNKLANSLKNIIFITKNINYKSNKLLSNLKINKNNKICNSKKNKSMYAGISILDKKKLLSLNLHKNEFISFENDIIEKFIFKGELYGISINNFFIDIGTKNNLKEANKNFVKKISEKCCFFDRDNTLIYDKGYTYKINDLKWKNGAIKAIKYLNSKGYKVIIITNQSGIGRGYFKESDLNKFHNEMNRRLNKEKANIDEFFYCPYSIHGKGKYKKISVDRKPNNGMLIKAINKWNIDIKKSIMIGNSHTDYLSAKKTKLKYFYVQNNLYSQIKKIIK